MTYASRPRGCGPQRRRQRGECAVAGERTLSAQHFIQHHAEREDVGPRIDRFALGLLGRHVGHGAQDLARRGQDSNNRRGIYGAAVGLSGAFGETEIEDFHAGGRDHHVAWLQVAMNDAARVSGGQCVRDLGGVTKGDVDGQRSLLEHVRQGVALDQFHDQRVGRPLAGPRRVGLLEAVDLGDVGMIERGQYLGLALEACLVFRIACERLWKNLDRDLAPESRIAGTIHLSHAACAKERQHFVRADVSGDGGIGERIGGRRRQRLDRGPLRKAPRGRVRHEQRFHLALQFAIVAAGSRRNGPRSSTGRSRAS